MTTTFATATEAPKGMKAIEVITSHVTSDEPCFYLAEMNRLSRSGKTMVRYQLLKIVRNDRLVTAYIYLGPSKKFTADQFQMVGGVVDDNGRGFAVHTVAELQDGADELRGRSPRRELEPLPLQNMLREELDQKGRFVKRRSSFGYKGQLVRP